MPLSWLLLVCIKSEAYQIRKQITLNLDIHCILRIRMASLPNFKNLNQQENICYNKNLWDY